jgi:hypothetical protein
VYVWYHRRYARITVIHRDFPKATLCSFCKITVSHCDSDISTILPNIGEIMLDRNEKLFFYGFVEDRWLFWSIEQVGCFMFGIIELYDEWKLYWGLVWWQALDYVIAEARRHRIRLLLTLVNNLQAYGGKDQYVKWAWQEGTGLSSSNDSFFYDPSIRSYYKTYVKVSHLYPFFFFLEFWHNTMLMSILCLLFCRTFQL